MQKPANWKPARTALLLAIVWVAIGPVLAEVVVAYTAWGAATGEHVLAERRADGAAALRALLGATALAGLAVYGLAQLLPGAWWVLLPLGAVAALACAATMTIREPPPPVESEIRSVTQA